MEQEREKVELFLKGIDIGVFRNRNINIVSENQELCVRERGWVGLGMRELGATGLKVSILGFGGSPLGNIFGSVKEEDAIASVHEAARLGINFFDVSPYYPSPSSNSDHLSTTNVF